MPKGITTEQMPIGLSKRKPRRVFGLGLLYFPSDPPPAIFIVVAMNLEGAYLSSILNVSADASAGIIITHTHNPERFRRILRQFAEVNDIGRLLPGHEFNRHIQMPADDLRLLLGLGPAYQRADNIVTHILDPAREELEALQETWFSYRMTPRTISFKVHYNLTEEEKLQLSRDCWDQCFRLLSAAGLSFRLIADLFPRVRPEDQPAFVAKLQSILLDISQRRDLRNPAAYVHAALEGWINSF